MASQNPSGENHIRVKLVKHQYENALKMRSGDFWPAFNPIRPGLFSRSPGPGGSKARMPKIKVNIN